MPKKTKKDKIIADLRRQHLKREDRNGKLDIEVGRETPLKPKDQDISPQHPSSSIHLPISNFNLLTSNPKATASSTNNLSINNTKYIKHDLVKTLILTTLVISFELMIYSKLR